MVGVPRSKGCSLCIRRRVKCDEARPSCGNCIRYGADCPGYDKGLKFVDGKHDVKTRAPRRKAQSNTHARKHTQQACESTLVIHGSSTKSLVPVSNDTSKPGTDIEMYHNTRKFFNFNPPSPMGGTPRTNRAQFISTMIDGIRVSESSMDLLFFEPWFDGLPAKLGYKASLDSSTCALTLHLLGKLKKDERAISEGRQLYGQSLAELQRALCHPTECETSETLCSAMLLGLYELFASTAPRSWRKHTSGVALLMQHRGAKSFNNEWDHGLLLAFRGLMIATSMYQYEESFLSKKPWRQLATSAEFTKRYLDDTLKPIPDMFQSIVDGHMLALSDLTLVFKSITEYLSGLKHGLDIDPTQKQALRVACEKQLKECQRWYDMLIEQAGSTLPTEIPSEDPESIYSTVIHFENPWVGTIFLGYWACCFLHKFTLRHIDPNKYGHFEAEAEKHRLDIMRSIECIGRGVSGAYRTALALRIVFEFSSPIEQTWMRTILRRFKPLYGAINPESFPQTKAHETDQLEIEVQKVRSADISWESFTRSI